MHHDAISWSMAMLRILSGFAVLAAWPAIVQGADRAKPALQFVLAGIAAGEAGERRVYAVGSGEGAVRGVLTVTCRNGELVAASYAAREGAGPLPGADVVRSGGSWLCTRGRR